MMRQTRYEDYKYVIQDLTHVYVGARYSYEELQKCDEAPFKLRAILSQYMLKEVEPSLTIAEHLMQIGDSDLSYMVYKQLKTRCKVYEWKEPDGKKIKKAGYAGGLYDIDGLRALADRAPQEHPLILEEISFKKLAMMAVSL